MYSIIFTLIILLLLFLKKRKKGEKIDFHTFLWATLGTLLISGVFFFLSERIVSFANAFLFDKKYEAKVVKYDYMEGDSESAPTRITIVEFKNEQNKTIQKSIGYGTSHPIEIGKTITITYKEGDKYFTNMNLGEQKLIVSFVLIFFVIFTIGMIIITLFALDKDLYLILKIAKDFVKYFIIPGALLSLLYPLSSAIWETYQGQRDDLSVWALGFSSFFVLLLTLVFFGYFRMLFKK